MESITGIINVVAIFLGVALTAVVIGFGVYVYYLQSGQEEGE